MLTKDDSAVGSEFAYDVPYTFNRTALQYNFWSVPYPYRYKKGVPYFLAKIEMYRTVLPFLMLTAQGRVSSETVR